MSKRWFYVIAVLMMIGAAGLRLWELNMIPAGLHADEITNLRLVDTIRRTGSISVFYPVSPTNQTGQEGLYHIAQALITTLVGTGSTGYRVLGTFTGLVTLALIYTLAVRLFGRVAGVAALAFISLNMAFLIISRTVTVASVMPLFIVGAMLALARALPVYHRQAGDDRSSTAAFAALGVVLGISLYVDSAGLMLVLGCMLFIAYVIVAARPLRMRDLSFIAFAILLMMILAVPYLLSTIRLPELAAPGRVFENVVGMIDRVVRGLLGILISGDMNPALNIPGRPLIDPISGGVVLLGLVWTLRNVRQPRYAMLLIVTLSLLPSALLVDNPPNFSGLVLLLPSLALFFGLGATILLRQTRGLPRRLIAVGLLGLLAFNIAWTGTDLIAAWPQREDVQTAYQTDLAQIAQHLDQTAGETPSIICDPSWQRPGNRSRLSRTQIVLLMMNRDYDANMRFVDCTNTLVFADGGTREQIVLMPPDMLQRMHPHIREWMDITRPLDALHLPEDVIFIFDDQQALADRLGLYTTMAAANYSFEARADDDTDPIYPPVRFGGNITWLGYELVEVPRYRAGDLVNVANYWRIEGIIPRDLQIFTHILSDPVTLVANRDFLGVNPRDLRERDVLLQIARMRLPEQLLPGEYTVSAGAYQGTSQIRLPVFDGPATRGDRIILYTLNVDPAPTE